MGMMDDIKNLLYRNQLILEQIVEQNIGVRPRNWHKSETLTATDEVEFNVKQELGDQGGRFLRLKVDKACTLKFVFEGVGDKELWEEGLESNKAIERIFKPPMTLKKFYLTPAANTTYYLWASTIENPVKVESEYSHLDADTFTAASDRAVLIAGQDGTNIRAIKVDAGGHIVGIDKGKNFTAEDLTINDGAITADGSFKEFDITADVDAIALPDSSIIEQIIITQLTFANNMNITFQLWEKDSSGYTPTTRADLYLKVLERDIINTDGEWSEIIEGIQYLRDRDGTNELHCRLVNNVGGEASDFAVVIKGRATLDNTATGDGGAV